MPLKKSSLVNQCLCWFVYIVLYDIVLCAYTTWLCFAVTLMTSQDPGQALGQGPAPAAVAPAAANQGAAAQEVALTPAANQVRTLRSPRKLNRQRLTGQR